MAVHHLGGDGEPLLVCHATGFHGRAYTPLARLLAERYAVWAVDLRGHGASNPPADGNFDWGGFRRDVAAVVEALGGGPVQAFGHSLGGGTILGAAAESPGLFSRAFVFEPIVIPTPTPEPGGFHMSAAARRRKDDFASREEALMRYAARGALSVMRSDALAAYVADGFVDHPEGGVRLACTPEHEARTFEATGKPHHAQMASVSIPVTVAVGLAEGGAPGMFAPLIADALPAGRLVEFPALGHFGPLQEPVSVAAAILAGFAATGGEA